MSPTRLSLLTALAMIAFAANSLLCRLALTATSIDPASFTTIRLISGALVLALLLWRRKRSPTSHGSWASAAALFVYAAGFSFAYIGLTAATGALLLFGAVQTTMIGYGLWMGERPNAAQVLGILMAMSGLLALLLPGVDAPPVISAMLMIAAGIAWGVYSLRGRGTGNALEDTAANFLRALPMTALISIVMWQQFELDGYGVVLAVASGALASGLGYAIWYTVLPAIRATSAATVQLSVPTIAAFGGVLLLHEPMGIRLILSSIAILGGVAVYILRKDSSTG